MTISYPNTTETMAERAWRYGEQGLKHWAPGRLRCFADGSVMSSTGVLTRHDRARMSFAVNLTDGVPWPG